MVDFPTVEVESTPVDVIKTEGCTDPPFPEPTFELPATACLGDTLQPRGLRNQLANGYIWNIHGPNGDTLTTLRNQNPIFVPEQTGSYTFHQTIYVFGCAYEFERQIEVTDQAVWNGPTEVSRCTYPATVTLDVNCDSLDVRWADGTVGTTRTLPAPGAYEVQVCSGPCAQNFTLTARRTEELLPSPLFALPLDTTVCAADLPLVVPHRSDWTLIVNGQPNVAAQLTEAGFYQIGYRVDGCDFTQTLRLRTEDCRPAVYLPNGFSPNFDGENDYFEPLFNAWTEPVELQVYDRWGSRLHTQTQGRLRWDGQTPRGPAPVGTYVVRVVYRELRSGRRVEVGQDVTLLR